MFRALRLEELWNPPAERKLKHAVIRVEAKPAEVDQEGYPSAMMATADLPARGPFSVEIGALYKRFGFDSASRSGSPGFNTTEIVSRTTGNSWEFPLLAKLRFRLLPGVPGSSPPDPPSGVSPAFTSPAPEP